MFLARGAERACTPVQIASCVMQADADGVYPAPAWRAQTGLGELEIARLRPERGSLLASPSHGPPSPPMGRGRVLGAPRIVHDQPPYRQRVRSFL